ncbi:hypothetical protein [Sphingomonas sp. TREG-RG-20F-R18-01]|uniref:hypothetical protein n=1 Tax=Sphingomonas sp. TREG-RG-20F-R18-01 TaxID=2914982 RepID=UPI001F5800B5|nr:hypothetical protein [Sphingomonas sp. TREG-RG-20F-R18-01]
MTVGDIIGGGFRLLRERIGAVLVWAVLYLGMNGILALTMRPLLHDMVALQRGTGSSVAPTALPGVMSQLSVLNLGMLLLVIVLYAAGLRAAVRPQESRFAFLRLGFDELRLLGVGAVLAILFTVAWLTVLMIATFLIALLSVASPIAGVLLAIPVVITVVALSVYLQVRMSLIFPLTMLRRRIALGEGWALSKGHFWTLFGAYFVIALIVMVAFTAVSSVTLAPYFADLANSHFSREALQLAQQHQLERQFGTIDARTILGWLLAAAAGAFWIALGAGALGTAAMGLLHAEFDDIGSIYE